MTTNVPSSATRERLISAAQAEFAEGGFLGTDTNRIARRAGFAPQTFYRWFKDKTEIFVSVYAAWEEQELRLTRALLMEGGTADDMVDLVVAHHRNHLVFRRSLRWLSLDDPLVREARAQSRQRQLSALASLGDLTPEGRITLLLQIERLADALAEGELADMGLSEAPTRQALASLFHGLMEDSVLSALRQLSAAPGQGRQAGEVD